MVDTIDTIPIATGSDGIIRVGGTRVTLDTIVAAFRRGATPEEIAQRYPSISLPDIYQVIGYYLKHSADLSPYLQRHQEEQQRLLAQNEAQWSPAGLRQRLLARRQSNR